MWVFYNAAFPLCLILILGFLSGGSYGKTVSSYDYYSITMLVYAILNTALSSSNSFMEERIKNANMRVLSAPIRTSYIYLSKILATSVFTFLCHLIVILFMYFLFNVNLGGKYIGYVLIIFFVFEFFASALGVLFCCIFKSENTANQILSLCITLFAILGGVFFRIGGEGSVMDIISYISPVKWIMQALFCIIYDSHLGTFWPTLLILVAAYIFLILLCRIFFKEEDYL